MLIKYDPDDKYRRSSGVFFSSLLVVTIKQIVWQGLSFCLH